MQLVGDKFADARVLRAARAYEAVHPFVMPKPETAAPRQKRMMAGTAHSS
jgi:Asp-tRNA(Asn)/Glu-tRNA(Gln) amidotransferase A subunit family amidase